MRHEREGSVLLRGVALGVRNRGGTTGNRNFHTSMQTSKGFCLCCACFACYCDFVCLQQRWFGPDFCGALWKRHRQLVSLQCFFFLSIDAHNSVGITTTTTTPKTATTLKNRAPRLLLPLHHYTQRDGDDNHDDDNHDDDNEIIIIIIRNHNNHNNHKTL